MDQAPVTHQCRLAVFDLDGTLKTVPSPYYHVHRALGVQEAAAAVHARYRQGEISYHEWGQEEIGLWRGLPVAELKAILSTIRYWPGAVEFVSEIKAAGVVVAVVSAGFDLHVQACAAELQADLAYFNHLGVADGRLTGEFITVVDGHNKGALVQTIQNLCGARRSETLVAGDTPYDIPMFGLAAVSLAVAPSEPAVAQEADLVLADGDWSRAREMIDALRPGWLPRLPVDEDS